ncbi:MAG: hypothetical protein Q8O76_12200 [Chloroflexota bacterium]|nr:hypothetical protein [Chloroflexota bacterium]
MVVTTKKLVVLEPVGEVKAPAKEQALSPRLEALEGKVIGILDDGFPDRLLRPLEQLLRERFEGVRTLFWMKPSLSAPAPSAMLDEIAQKCDAVVVGLCA